MEELMRMRFVPPASVEITLAWSGSFRVGMGQDDTFLVEVLCQHTTGQTFWHLFGTYYLTGHHFERYEPHDDVVIEGEPNGSLKCVQCGAIAPAHHDGPAAADVEHLGICGRCASGAQLPDVTQLELCAFELAARRLDELPVGPRKTDPPGDHRAENTEAA